MPNDTLSRQLARYIRSLPVQDRDLAEADRMGRDWIGSLAAGGATAQGRILREYAAGESGLESRVFLAAALSHITETDDLHRGSVSHPACVVVPVALLLGAELQADGRRVLHAVLAGYEAMLRVGEALGPGHYRIFHNTATAGVFGAAAASAMLLELDEDAWVWALGNAGTQAAGLWQFNEDSTMSKHLHAGHAASAGLRAARLAQVGFTGAGAILEGEKGFFRALCPDPAPERVLAAADGWKLPETSFKPYPSCRHTHPAIDAALSLREAVGPERAAGEITEISIGLYPAAVGIVDRPEVPSTYAAKFSVQFCIASALLYGAPGLEAFEGDRLTDTRTLALIERTRVHVDPELEAGYPESWGAFVEVKDGDGRVDSERCLQPLGDPERPLTDADINRKAMGLMRYGGWSEEAADRILQGISQMRNGGAPIRLPWIDLEPGTRSREIDQVGQVA